MISIEKDYFDLRFSLAFLLLFTMCIKCRKYLLGYKDSFHGSIAGNH